MSGIPLPNPVQVQPEEVLAAVSSLYDDELKPFGRILRKRVAGIVASTQSKMVGMPTDPGDDTKMLNVDMEQLRGVCEMSQQLEVQTEDGGDWSVLLVGRTASFVYVNDPNDMYPADLWVKISEYFGGRGGIPSRVLPGGRFSCAQELFARKLPFLVGLSLGSVCHVVQLAISQKKILGYLNGAVVPYANSQSMMKERRAERQLPCSKIGTEIRRLPLATIELTRACLKAIFKADASCTDRVESEAMVPLSNIKRIFRSQYQLELSETVLGHTKLSELLQDDCFSDICTVKLVGSGYAVVPVVPEIPATLSLATNLFSPRAEKSQEVGVDQLPRYVQIGQADTDSKPSIGPPPGLPEPSLLRMSSSQSLQGGVEFNAKTSPMGVLDAHQSVPGNFLTSNSPSLHKFSENEVPTAKLSLSNAVLHAPPGLEDRDDEFGASRRAFGRDGNTTMPVAGEQRSFPTLLTAIGGRRGHMGAIVEKKVDGCDRTRDWHLCGKNLQPDHPRQQQDCDQNRQWQFWQQQMFQEQYQKFTQEEYKQRQIMGVVRHLVDSGVDFATACSIATITEIAEDAVGPNDKFKFGNDDAVFSGKSPASGYIDIGARQNYPELSLSDLVPR